MHRYQKEHPCQTNRREGNMTPSNLLITQKGKTSLESNIFSIQFPGQDVVSEPTNEGEKTRARAWSRELLPATQPRSRPTGGVSGNSSLYGATDCWRWWPCLQPLPTIHHYMCHIFGSDIPWDNDVTTKRTLLGVCFSTADGAIAMSRYRTSTPWNSTRDCSNDRTLCEPLYARFAAWRWTGTMQ